MEHQFLHYQRGCIPLYQLHSSSLTSSRGRAMSAHEEDGWQVKMDEDDDNEDVG